MIDFRGRDDALKITKRVAIDWRDHLIKTYKANTIRKVHFQVLRSILSRAVELAKEKANPASDVKQKPAREVVARDSVLFRSRGIANHKNRNKPCRIWQ